MLPNEALPTLLHIALGAIVVLLFLYARRKFRQRRQRDSHTYLHSPSPLGYQLVGDAKPPKVDPRYRMWTTLTLSERAVALEIARGNRKDDVARVLNMNKNTVLGHAKKVYDKLDVHSNVELAHLLRDLGVLKPPDP